MKSPALIGLAWAGTLALAFLLGVQMRPAAPGREPLAAPAEPPASPGPPSESLAPEPRAAAPAPAAAPTPEQAPVAADEETRAVALEEGMTAANLSALFMRYAAGKLAQGPEGHKELFREMDRLLRDREVRKLARDESQLMPLLYPWVRFLVERDRQVVAMMETLYETAAEDPMWFQEIDDDTFEIFTEGLAVLLPGVADEVQLGRFRAHVEKILASPAKESLPEALQRNWNDLQRNLEWWSPPLVMDDLLLALADPARPVGTKLALLRRATRGLPEGVDVTEVLAEGLRAGHSEAVQLIASFPRAANTATLDLALLDGVAQGRINWFQVVPYCQNTGRATWEAKRPLYVEGLRRGGKSTEAFAQSFLFLRQEVPKEFVADVVASYALPPHLVDQLKRTYGLE
jgi:hypothetical protein